MPLNIDFLQVLLHLFNFVILGGGLYFLLYKPIRAFMDKREASYETMDQQAKKTLQEAKELKASYEDQLSKAQEEISALRQEAEKSLQKEREEMLQEARSEAESLKKKSLSEAQLERDKMMHQARKEIRGLAEDAAERLAKKQLSGLYDEFLETAEKESSGGAI